MKDRPRYLKPRLALCHSVMLGLCATASESSETQWLRYFRCYQRIRLDRRRSRRSTVFFSYGNALAVFLTLSILGCEFNSPSQSKPVPSQPRPVVTTSFEQTSSANSQSEIQTLSASPDDWFDEVTGQTGIEFAHRNGRDAERYLMIESFGGGVAIVDYDLDDAADIFVTGGGSISLESPVQIRGLPSALFRNAGDWIFTPVTTLSGLGATPDFSQGCAVSDYNGDGFPDVFVCCYGRSRLYENAGDGTFLNPTNEQRLPARGWGTAAAFGDWDRDGFPDLFLARYTDWSLATDVPCYGSNRQRDLCGPTSYPGTACQFFRNTGDGSFEDQSENLGLVATAHGLGVVSSDLNLDGWIDFYVSSDALPNHLYLGGPGNKLLESGMTAGVAVGEWGQPEASMGIDVADYNGDGLPDLFVTNFEKEDHSIYRNLGGGLWIHSTVAAGLSASSRLRVGFGTSFCDFDGDHWPDLFVLNGNPIYTTAESPFAQKPQLFRNLQGKRFVEISDRGGSYFHEAHSGRGSAVGDLDNDGDFDLVAVLMNEPIRLLRNRRESNHFISVQLCAKNGDREAIGARVTCHSAGRQWTQFVVRGGSYFSQSDSRIIFPIEETESSVTVTVAWPGRSTEAFNLLEGGRTHRLIEGRGVIRNESD